MKASLLTFGLLFVAHTASAMDLILTDGRTFHDATIVSQTPRKVVVKHTNGLSGIEKALLPADLSARYPIDEAAAREADRQAAEARTRTQAFHKAEAERAAIIRLEREQTALHNAQVAALEASQRLADAEAARIASQRTEVVYEYVSFNRTPYYVHSRSNSSGCEPRWNEKSRDHRFVRDHRTNSDTDRHSHRQNLAGTPTVHRTHNPSAVPRILQKQSAEEEQVRAKVAAAVVRR